MPLGPLSAQVRGTLRALGQVRPEAERPRIEIGTMVTVDDGGMHTVLVAGAPVRGVQAGDEPLYAGQQVFVSSLETADGSVLVYGSASPGSVSPTREAAIAAAEAGE